MKREEILAKIIKAAQNDKRNRRDPRYLNTMTFLTNKGFLRTNQAFFTAANTLDSDYEHGRTLLSVVERGEVPQPVVLAVLASAKQISSDHELSELLMAVITTVRMDDTIRAAIRDDAGSISSQYDRGRVFEALARE